MRKFLPINTNKIMDMKLYFVIIIIIIVFSLFYNRRKKEIKIYIGNSFKNYYILPKSPIMCEKYNKLYNCIYSRNKNIEYNAAIFNGNRKFPHHTNYTYNIIMTTEKLSQVRFMKDIGDGKNKYYHLAVDYRLFNNKWHISYPIFSKYNLHEFIHIAKSNFNSISLFLKRKNIVYIQRVSYFKRQYIIKEFMKYLNIDSYGNDLNNKKWPKNISRKNKVDIIKNYKFCIAIENSIITWNIGNKYQVSDINNDYVTEKLTDCMLAGSIPIYFGPKNINLFLPHPNSIINFSDYDSIKNLTDYIKIIMNNSNLLEIHLQWFKKISVSWFNRFNNTYYFNYCKICSYVK